jgi:hypothetical protein
MPTRVLWTEDLVTMLGLDWEKLYWQKLLFSTEEGLVKWLVLLLLLLNKSTNRLLSK